MTDDPASVDDRPEAEDTDAAIMAATYRALCRHGYAGLTMQAIADEFDRSKATLHYHYDTKQDLLVAFLEYLLERFGRRIAVDGIDDPTDRLSAFVDTLLFGPPERDDRDHWEFHTALLEIRSQAPHEPAFREQLTVNHETVQALAAEIIRDGIDRGEFREVDPDETAALLLACIHGARIYQVTLDGDEHAERARDAIDALVLGPLSADGDGVWPRNE